MLLRQTSVTSKDSGQLLRAGLEVCLQPVVVPAPSFTSQFEFRRIHANTKAGQCVNAHGNFEVRAKRWFRRVSAAPR